MKIFSDFGNGFINCFKAFTLLFERGLWHYIFYPILIWAAIFIASLYGFVALADYLTELIKPYLSVENISDASYLAFLKPKLTGAFSFIITWLLKIVFWFVGSIFSKYLLLIILSPLFSLLSESADEKLTGNKFPFNLLQLLKDVLRGITVNIRNMFMELFLTFALWLITIFFPPLIFITFPLGLIIGWYFIGFNLLDYSCERHKLSVRDGIRFIKRHRGYAIGIGCVYSVFLLLPTFAGNLIGLMFGPILAVIGATMSFLEIKKKEINPS